MSRETSEWLNRNVLIGYTSKRGNAWHYRAADQGDERNHYTGAIPPEAVQRRLFHWDPVIGHVDAVLDEADERPVATRSDRHKAIMRSDTKELLGIVSPTYTIHPYRTWLLENVTQLIGEAGIGSAGLLEGGAKAWVQVEVPENCTAQGVTYRPFLMATTSLDGSMATTYLAGAQVVVCDNTLRAALRDREALKLRIRHSTRSEFHLDSARDAMGVLEATQSAFARQVAAQLEVKVDREAWRAFLQAHFPLKDQHRYEKHVQFDRRRELDELWHHDDRVAPWAGTAYGVVAAVNTYQHHIAEGRASRGRVERNAYRAATGGFDEIDTKTLRVLTQVLPDARRLLTDAP